MDLERYTRWPIKQRTPYIIIEGTRDWGAIKKWDPDFFQDKFDELEVTLNYDLPTDRSSYLQGTAGHCKTISLGEAIDFMKKSDRCYIAQQDISVFDGIEKDYDLCSILPKVDNLPTYTNLWIGKNTQSGLHYDYNDNFLIQVYGSKKVFLVAPEETQYLYPLPQNFTKTQVNPCNPDFDKFPKFKNAVIWKGELCPGEALFIPKGWFHHIYAPKESISLNCWFGPGMKAKDFLLSFYRSGWPVWSQFLKDFIWHGIFRRPEKDRLFCSQSLGKEVYMRLLRLI